MSCDILIWHQNILDILPLTILVTYCSWLLISNIIVCKVLAVLYYTIGPQYNQDYLILLLYIKSTFSLHADNIIGRVIIKMLHFVMEKMNMISIHSQSSGISSCTSNKNGSFISYQKPKDYWYTHDKETFKKFNIESWFFWRK